MAALDACLLSLSSKDSKVRLEALTSLLDVLDEVAVDSSALFSVCKLVSACISDNNQKASAAACSAIVKLAETAAGSAGAAAFDVFIEPLAELSGHAKPQARVNASDGLDALVSCLGAPATLSGLAPHLSHRNWRVREGTLRAVARFIALGLAQPPPTGWPAPEFISKACEALADAQPDVRSAGVEALAALGCVSGIQRVLAAMAAGEARPTHVASVRERHAILAAALESLRQLGGAGSARRGASTHDPASVSFPRSNSSAALPPQAAPQRAERGPSPAGIALVFAAHAENSIETCADGPSAAAAVSLAEKATGLSLQQAAASLRRGASGAMPPRSTQTGIPPMSARGASGGALAASTTAGRIRRASDAVSLHSDAASSTGGDDDGGGGRGVMSAGDWGVVTSVAVDEAAVDPQVQSLCSLHESRLWIPGVLGFRDEVGRVRAVEVSTLKEAQRVIEQLSSVCANSAADWKQRTASLESLRSAVAGGMATVEGVASLVPQMRDALCAQILDLRSSIVRQACLAVSELSAALAFSQAFEPLADALVDALLKQTSVSIAIIATSAVSAAHSIIHNTKHGFHRVVAKLCAASKSKSPVQRAHVAECLLRCVRGWPLPVLDRHVEELHRAVIALISDADGAARSAGRLLFWSFTAVFPFRAESLLGALSAKVQSNVDDAREDAVRSAIDYFCSPISPMPHILMLSPSGGGGGSGSSPPTSPGGFAGGGDGSGGRPRRVAAPALSSGATSHSPRATDELPGGSSTARPATAASKSTRSPDAPVSSLAGRRAQSAIDILHAGAGGATPTTYRQGSGAPPHGPSHGPPPPQPQPDGRYAVSQSVRPVPKISAPPAPSQRQALAAPHQRQQQHEELIEAEVMVEDGLAFPEDRAARVVSPRLVPREPVALSTGDAKVAGAVGVLRAPPVRPAPRFESAIGAAVAKALAAGQGDARTLRDACAALCNTLMVSRAVDSRAFARAYGDRLPSEVCVPPQALLAVAEAAGGAASPTGGSLPIVCEVDVAAAQALDRQLRSGAVGSLILACLRHSHENVQADGLALLCALADTTLDVSSPVIDELSDVVFGSDEEASRMPHLCAGGEAAGTDLPVRMTSLTVSSGAGFGAGKQPASTAAAAGVRVVTVVPVYALGLMRGSTAAKPSSAMAAPSAASDGGSSGPGVLFRDIYASLVFLTTVSAEAQRSPGKRAVAALRRACPVGALLTCTLAALVNPAAEQRSLWSALMLAYSMLGEPGGPDFFGVPARMNKLVERAAHILAAAVTGSAAAGGSASSGAAPAAVGGSGNTAARLGSFVQQISHALHAAHPAIFVAAFARLPPHLQRPMARYCDAAEEGSIPGLVDRARALLQQQHQGGGPAPVAPPPLPAPHGVIPDGSSVAAAAAAAVPVVALAPSAGARLRVQAPAAASAAAASRGAQAAALVRVNSASLLGNAALAGGAGGRPGGSGGGGGGSYAAMFAASSTAAAADVSRTAPVAPAPAPTAGGLALSVQGGAGGSRFDLLDLHAAAVAGAATSVPAAAAAAAAPPPVPIARNASAARLLAPAPAALAAPTAVAAQVTGQQPSLAPQQQRVGGLSLAGPPLARTADAAAAGPRGAPVLHQAPSSGGGSGSTPLPLSRANLQYVVEMLGSAGDRAAQMRGLHFFGRSADTQPLAAGGPAPPPPVLRPLAVGPLPPVPAEHRDDAVWLSLFDRAVAGVLAFVAAQLDVDALLLVAAAAAASEPAAAPPAAAGGAALRPNQLLPEVPPDTNVAVQTALSVLRKLFRNCAPYMLAKSGVVLAGLARAARGASGSRDLCVIFDKTIDECAEAMPADVTLTHLVGCLSEAPLTSHGPGTAAQSTCVLRALARVVPRLPSGLVLRELDAGRLMEGLRTAFGSDSTEVRKAVVGTLVALHGLLRAAFAPFAEAYLSIQQQKLVQIYIDKAAGPGGAAP